MCDVEFLREIARAMQRAGYDNRSKFIRDAVYEKLVKLHIPVSYRMAMAPTRIDKAGATKKRKKKK